VLHLAQGLDDAGAGDTRQRGDVLGARGLGDEVRLDEMARPQLGLGDQIPDGSGASQATRADEHGVLRFSGL